MYDHDVRPLARSEFRSARELFNRALHWPSQTDDQWARTSAQFEPGRVLGAFSGGELEGTTRSLSSSLTVPGGAVLPASAVTGVAVRADRTRRGVLTALMRAQLDAVLKRGEGIAMLHASESPIYGRFGYGVATRTRTVSMRSGEARVRRDAPSSGEVRLVDLDTAANVLPEIYRRIGQRRPGMIERSDGWWQTRLGHDDGLMVVAVHANRDGRDDGFVVYEPKTSDHRFGDGTCTLQVSDIQAGETTAAVELWRFLLGVDLVTHVVAAERPVDEPLEWWLTDRRSSQVSGIHDDLWVRMVDVETTLRARTFGAAAPVVIELRDAFLPENSGNYRVGPDGVERSSARAQLSLDVSTLSALYLGDVSVSTLAGANLVEVHDPEAVSTADALFSTREIPWCGTAF